MGFFLVMKAEMVRNWIIMRRYWFRTILGLAMGYGILLAMVLGFMSNKDGATEAARHMIGQNAVNGILGLIIGMFAFGVVGMFTQGLSEMAQSGQLEQLCMSPHGLITNFMARSFVGSVSNVLTSSLLVWLLAKSIGGQLHADFVPTVLLLALTFSNLIGFGFMVGGLVLVFKQTGQIAVIIRMALLALAFAVTDERMMEWRAPLRWAAHALPITDATLCLKYVLVKGQMQPVVDALGVSTMQHVSLYAYPPFFLLLVSCVFWTTVGMVCFRLMEDWSRSKGTLGAY